MTSERPGEPIEPTEILPRASSGTDRLSSSEGRHRPVRRSPVGPLPVLTSAAAAGVVVAGGVAAAAAFSGIKAAGSLARLLTGARGAPAVAAGGVVFRYSASSIVGSAGRMDWVHVEMRWGPHDG